MHFHNGAVAKVIATVVTYPLQVVQTRVRVSYIMIHPELYNSDLYWNHT